MAKNRLSRELWIAAGFKALAEQGSVALKAEPLARRLNTTKGSFYWHFQDVPAFQAALLADWETQAKAQLALAQGAGSTPAKRLRELGEMVNYTASNTAHIEPAIRAWARETTLVAEAMDRVDQLRLAYLNQLLADMGLTNADISRLIYGSLLGMQELSTRDGQANGEALGTLVDLVLALYEEA